jgi:lipoyl(octanoyl) transferase
VTSLSSELGREVTVHDVLPNVRAHLTDLLAWGPYEPTPDYERRPEPGRESRVSVLGLPH